MPRSRKPPTAATGLPYGEAGKLQAAQAAMPLPTAPTMPTGPSPALTAAQNMPPSAGLFTQPSDNPQAPPSHGIPMGMGPGPSALPDPRTFVPPVSDDWMLARYLPTLEAAANGDGGSSELRQLVRRIRGNINPQVTQAALVQQTAGPPPAPPAGTPTVNVGEVKAPPATLNVGQIGGGVQFNPAANLDTSQVQDLRGWKPGGGGSW